MCMPARHVSLIKLVLYRVVDFGSVYASKTFKLKDGRRLLLGWVYETAVGCEAECSAGTNFTDSLVGADIMLASYIVQQVIAVTGSSNGKG